MALSQQDITRLGSYFVSKSGGILQGELTPDIDLTHDLGRADHRWDTIYAGTVIADNIQSGSGVGDADTVDGFDAAGNPIASTLLALDPQGIFPDTVFPSSLLKDGSRALEDNLTVVAGATIDGVDIGAHTHTGVGSSGLQLTHANLLSLDADDHLQYAERAQDETITGDWMFTHLVDRSAGWIFLPDEKLFKAIPHNLVLKADENEASIGIGPYTSSEYAIYLFDDTTPTTYIKVGRANDSITLSGTDATYRLWAGHVDGASAPFRVEKDGSILATDGEIAGWTITATSISKNDLVLHSDGYIAAGTGDNLVRIDSQDATWRLWAGNATAGNAPFRVNKTGDLYIGSGYVSGVLRSTNFISGQQGFSLNSSGLAEFDNIIARGRLQATVFAEATISVASGKLIISDGAVFGADMADTDDYFVVDAPVFLANDIVRMKPDVNRDEWMRITSPYSVDPDGYKYFVVRELNAAEGGYAGPYDFYAGESVVRMGSAEQVNLAFPLASGEEGGEYGEYQPGGSGSTTGGGFLILEGSRQFGPYFGVAARYGPVYDQLLDVVRIGNLDGVLDYTSEEWGAFFGDANAFMTYDQTQGLRIEFSGTGVDTVIDDTGIATEAISIAKVTAPGNSIDPYGFLYHDTSDNKLYWKYIGTSYDLTAGAAGAPSSAQYVVMAFSGGLSAERRLQGTVNQVTLTDGGAEGDATFSLPSAIILTGASSISTSSSTLSLTPVGNLILNPTALITLSKGLSANWDAGGFEIRSNTFRSDVVTGTAPFIIASQTVVGNLNVDLLDDQEGSYYLDSANFTGTDWTDLTDSGETTLHSHAAGATAAHVLATTGPHTGELPWADMAVGTQGSIIRRGASDWEEYALGTTTYVLKAGATDVAWGQVAFSELTGDIVYTQLDSLVDTSGGGSASMISGAQHVHTDADGSTKVGHGNLSGISIDQHHARDHDIEGVTHTAAGLTIGHVLRASGAAAFSFAALIAADIPQLDHGGLSGLGDDDHGAVYPNFGSAETITGGWTFNTAVTTFDSALQSTSDFTINPGGDFIVNSDRLALVGSAGNITLLEMNQTGTIHYGGFTWKRDGTEVWFWGFNNADDSMRLRNAGTTDRLVISTDGTTFAFQQATTISVASGSITFGSETIHDVQLQIKGIAAPGAGAAGYGHLYAKTDGKIYFHYAGGAETDLTAGGTTLPHVLATSGPHTGELPFADLAVGTQGSIIRRGAADWEEYVLGTTNYVLKAGATDVAWGQVAFSELTGDIVYTQLDSIVDTSGVGTASMISAAVHQHTDADGSTKVDHANLSGVSIDQHHARDHDIEGSTHTAAGLTIGHVLRASGAAAFSFAALIAADIPTLDHGTGLSGLDDDDHGAVYPNFGATESISGAWTFTTANPKLNDSVELHFGTDNDTRMTFSGSDFVISNYTGGLYIQSYVDSGVIILRANDAVPTTREVARLDAIYGLIVNNDQFADINFYVKGETDANLIMADAGLNAVGLGGAGATGWKLSVYGKQQTTFASSIAATTFFNQVSASITSGSNEAVGYFSHIDAESGTTSPLWAFVGEVWAEPGAAVQLVGMEQAIVSEEDNNPEAKVGLDLAFKDRADGQTATQTGLGSNRYNENTRAVQFASQARSTDGEYAGWQTAFYFTAEAFDRSLQFDYTVVLDLRLVTTDQDSDYPWVALWDEGTYEFGLRFNPSTNSLNFTKDPFGTPKSIFKFGDTAIVFNDDTEDINVLMEGNTELVFTLDAGLDSIILGPKTTNAMPDGTTSRLVVFSDGTAPSYPISTVAVNASNIFQQLSVGPYSDIGAGFLARAARGTFASPTQTQSGDRLGFFLFGGVDNVDGWGNQAGFLSYTTQAYTASARGTKFQIVATAQNAASRGVVMEFFGEGHIDSFGGTSNPTTNISAGSLFYRTDLHMWIEYDGTQWLTTHEYMHSNDYSTATATGTVRIAPLRTDYGIYVTNVELNLYISGTNDGSNYWTVVLRGATVSWSNLDTFHSYVTSGDSGSTWISDTGAPSVKNIPTYYNTFAIGLTKTSSPGNCLYNVAIYYRLIIT